jgi:hypothetical protein
LNFFGHAVVASWRSRSAAHALGAMLPDLAGMCGARVPLAPDQETAAGIALHHATDSAFHRLPLFTAAIRSLEDRLLARGVERGPARGAAHVGFELCLDGALLDEPGAAALYLSGIEIGRGPLRGAFDWRPPEGLERWHLLIDRLGKRGVPLAYRDPDQVTDRVALALSRRPRLSLDSAAVAAVRAEMRSVVVAAADAAPAILAALRAELAG